MGRCSIFALLTMLAVVLSGCVAHKAVTTSLGQPQGMQTMYPEQEVFVSLPWVAGKAKPVLAP